ncbi:MAG: protein kinase, partial [bacterium]|nr:protein kinase [bacterium]
MLFDQWRIIRELGRGGFGVVFEAEELHLGETLAIKVLDPAMTSRPKLLTRFRREVSVMRRLESRRIVRVYDYREDPDEHLALISMEYVAGGTVRGLRDLARENEQAVPVAVVVAILAQTLEALAEAH